MITYQPSQTMIQYKTRLLYLITRKNTRTTTTNPNVEPRTGKGALLRHSVLLSSNKTFPSSFFLSSFANIHSIPYSTGRYTHTHTHTTLVLYLFHTAFSGKTVISSSVIHLIFQIKPAKKGIFCYREKLRQMNHKKAHNVTLVLFRVKSST